MGLRDATKNLLSFYKDVVDTHNRLEHIGKSYQCSNHKNQYIEKFNFYNKLVNSPPARLFVYLPQILVDKIRAKKHAKTLHENKEDLEIYSKLVSAGASFLSWGKPGVVE